MKYFFYSLLAIVMSVSNGLGQHNNNFCTEEITLSTLHLAEEKLFTKNKEVIAQEISDLLKKAELGNKDTEHKMYQYRVKINEKGEITDIFLFKTQNTNKKINTLLKNYIQTLALFRQSAYIDKEGRNRSFVESFSIYIQIEEKGISLKMPSQEFIMVN